MRQLTLIVTLMFAFSFTQVEAQTPSSCSPEWCKIFCGENATNCTTAQLQNCKPADCKPADCKKVASSTPSCSPVKVAKTVNTKPSCVSKAVNVKPSCAPKNSNASVNSKPTALPKATAKKVSFKSENHEECCSWIPGCCLKPAKKDDEC